MIDSQYKNLHRRSLSCHYNRTYMNHIATAKAIAKELNILGSQDKAITGQELDKIPQNKLEKEIANYSVFARVTPEHKVRIVKAWQSTGAVVAMTGDGVKSIRNLRIFRNWQGL